MSITLELVRFTSDGPVDAAALGGGDDGGTADADLDEMTSLAVACSQVYRYDPRFGPPETVWSRLAAAMPTLLQHGPSASSGQTP